MVWGAAAGSSGVDDLCKRLRENDPKLVSLILLRHRKLGPEEVRKLCDALVQSHTLKELSITGHTLSPESSGMLAGMLAANRSITTLSIGDSSFGDAGMAALAPGVAASQSLTDLDAELKGIGPEGAGALGQALSQSKCVSRLTLAHNPLGDAGVRMFCSHPWPSLRSLDLSACGMSSAAGLSAVASAPSATTLHTLTCTDAVSSSGSSSSCAANAGSEASAASSSPAAAAATSGGAAQAGQPPAEDGNTTSTQSSCASAADAQAAAAVGVLLRACTSLQKLKLHGMQLGDAGAAAAANAIQKDGSGRCLTQLELGCNGIGEAGGLAIADAFTSTSCPLASLSLEGNPINDAVVTLIAETCVRRCSTSGAQPLCALDLSTTKVGIPGIQALSTIPRLCKLSLFGCKLGDEGVAVLAQCLKHPRDLQPSEEVRQGGFQDLQELVISGCGVTRQGMQVLLQALTLGHGASLSSIEMGGNPCCQVENFQDAVADVTDARPLLAIHWRAGASDSHH